MLKTKTYKFILKVRKFQLPPFTVLAQQREKHGYGCIPPPVLNMVKLHITKVVHEQIIHWQFLM